MKAVSYLGIALSLSASVASYAGTLNTILPDCRASGKLLSLNNSQVADWKTTTKNEFLGRAHVTGTIKHIYADHSKHNHFEIQLNTAAGDTLEIIFSQCDGTLPPLHAGMKVEACGDYITATAPSGGNPPSPDGAILHWVHKDAPTDLCGHKYGNVGGHDSGYVAIDDQLYGWH